MQFPSTRNVTAQGAADCALMVQGQPPTYARNPRAKFFRIAQAAKLAIRLKENLLCHIFGIGAACQDAVSETINQPFVLAHVPHELREVFGRAVRGGDEFGLAIFRRLRAQAQTPIDPTGLPPESEYKTPQGTGMFTDWRHLGAAEVKAGWGMAGCVKWCSLGFPAVTRTGAAL